MRAILVTVIFTTFISLSSFAQSGSGFGIKGGLNYNSNGRYIDAISNLSENPDAAIGYHIGVYGKLGTKLYFRPELVYTSTKSKYNHTGDFKMQKLDAPLLIGYKVIGPLHVFAGPALQYILNTDVKNTTVEAIENDFSIGFNFGIGLNISKIGIDLRYERAFSDNEATLIANNTNIAISKLDTRPTQLILSLSYKLY